MEVTVDRFGRVLIPKKLRDKLGIKEGQSLELDEESGRLWLEPTTPTSALVRKGSVLIFQGQLLDADVDYVALDREKRMRVILGEDDEY
jgi:AbrB family looped-hinge helix DNA binding protein